MTSKGRSTEELQPGGAETLTEAEWEAACTVEIARRLRDLDEGRTAAITLEEFQARVQARLPHHGAR